MNKFLTELLTFILFMASIVSLYFAIMQDFSSHIFNVIILFAGIFFFIQAVGFIDRIKGFGQYNNQNKSKPKSKSTKKKIEKN